MNARLIDFHIMDALRSASGGLPPEQWCEQAGVLWLRYLRIRFEGFTPTLSELDGFKRALDARMRTQKQKGAV